MILSFRSRADQILAFLEDRKIPNLGTTPEALLEKYSPIVLVTPTALRGF
jgi:hypothetical protein